MNLLTNYKESGIYICTPALLDHFKDNFDYECIHDLLNELNEFDNICGFSIYTEICNEYLNRVSSLYDYKTISMDLINRKVLELSPDFNITDKSDYTKIESNENNMIFYKDKNTQIHISANIDKSIIGKNTIIDENCIILNSVIGNNCKILYGTIIQNSFIFDHSIVDKDSIINNSIISHNVIINNNCHINDGCIVNNNINLPNKTIIDNLIKLTTNNTSKTINFCEGIFKYDISPIPYCELIKGWENIFGYHTNTINNICNVQIDMNDICKQEIVEYIKISIINNYAINDIIIEIGRSKLMYNITPFNIALFVICGLSNYILTNPKQSSLNIFTKYNPVIKKFIDKNNINESSQIINTLQNIFQNNEQLMSIIIKYFVENEDEFDEYLYDELFINWYNKIKYSNNELDQKFANNDDIKNVIDWITN